MTTATSGSLRLFRAAGVDVFLHWSWFLVAVLMVSRKSEYAAPAWQVAEYVGLFVIVLLHEYGHCLACRQVGGEADTIVLWPLGGIAFVRPPERPGAVLWSVAAGPLVNVGLLVPTWGLVLYGLNAGWAEGPSDAYRFVRMIAMINAVLLAFNLIPAYPLDGGQMLMAVLWYQTGRWAALLAAGVVGIGFAGLLAVASLACAFFDPLSGGLTLFLAVFAGLRSLAAVQAARHFLHMEKLPRHADCACPRCGVPPPAGPLWACEHCEGHFDLFDARGRCPECGAWYLEPHCPGCHGPSHIDRWFAAAGGQAGIREGLPHGVTAEEHREGQGP